MTLQLRASNSFTRSLNAVNSVGQTKVLKGGIKLWVSGGVQVQGIEEEQPVLSTQRFRGKVFDCTVDDCPCFEGGCGLSDEACAQI